jgi:site-specific recombinase XerD
MEFTTYLQLKGYSSKSITTIEKKAGYFKAWCAKENITDEAEISHNDIIAYIKHCTDKGITNKTAANYLSHVKTYYDYLVKVDIAKGNPCSNIIIKGIKKRALYDIIPFEQLEKLYHGYTITAVEAGHECIRKRNKVMLGLLVYQGLQSEELMKLEVQDLQLREGRITIHAGRKSASRIMKPEAHQVYELMDYLSDTRKGLLHQAGKTPKDTTLLFITADKGMAINSNTLTILIKHLRSQNGKVTSLNQIRASVIVHWLKLYNLRKVQYLAGHKYISSTEAYKSNNLEDLKEDISKYHPF